MKKIFYYLLLVFCWINNAAYSQLPGSGNAMSFDGIDDEVALGSFFTYQNFTVEMWVKPGAAQISFADIMDNNHTDNQNWVCQQDGYNNNINQYFFGCTKTAGPSTLCHFSLTANVWQHLALVKTATTLATYVNGILSETIPWSGSINFSNQFLRLGRWGFGGRNWNGSLDEVRIWNTPLSQSAIRERMCRKIKADDPLYNHLVAYYNFDETAGSTVVDGTANLNTGTLINGTARITSGAAIGYASTSNYVTTGLPSVALRFNSEDKLSVTYTGGSYSGQAGTHVYVVNEKPTTENGITGVGSNNRYFGVYNVNITAPAYNAEYNYTGNPFVTAANEPDISLFKRANNSDLTWLNANANINLATNTITAVGQNTEYMLGVQPCGNYSPIITAGGPVSFCQGGSVTLTSTAAATYLWSNGAVTQSITVNTAGTYTVTAINFAGCTSTSAGLKVTISGCTIFCTASGCSSSRGYIRHIFTCYGVNNTSGWNNGYADFTNLTPTPVSPGRGFGMEITPGFLPNTTDPGVYLRVWIDWNNNGYFTDLGELVWCPYYKINMMSKGWIKVPAWVAPGPIRMRVAVRADVPAVSCGSFTYGEVEDYTINIRTFRPSDPVARQEDWEEPEYTGNDFSIYPNPVAGKMIIERSGYNEANATLTPAQMQLADVNGKILLQAKLTVLVQAFDVSRIASGIYFVTIKTSSGAVSTRKIFIQH